MPEDNDLDTGSETLEGGLPKPTFQETSQPASSELSAEAIAKQFEQRLKETEDKLRRELQSQKDKELASIRKSYGDLSELQSALAEVKAGGDPDKVYAAIEQRSLYQKVADLEARFSAPNQTSSNGRTEADEAFDKALGLVSKAGLSNDPEIQGLFKGNYKNPADFLFAVNEKVLTRNTKPAPSPASASSPPGGGATATNAASAQARVDAILSDSKRLMTPEGVAELAAARAELQQLEAQ